MKRLTYVSQLRPRNRAPTPQRPKGTYIKPLPKRRKEPE